MDIHAEQDAMRQRVAARTPLEAVQRVKDRTEQRRQARAQLAREHFKDEIASIEAEMRRKATRISYSPPSAFDGLTPTEQRVLEQLQTAGAEVFRNGWPDFAVRINGQVFAVEVKRNTTDEPKPNQAAMHDLLRAVGIKVIVINGSYKDLLAHIRLACNAEGVDF